MKKYIAFLMVAAATMFFASCEFASAEEPDSQRANKLLWGRVSEGLSSEFRHMQVVAHLNEIMLTSGEEATRLSPVEQPNPYTGFGECEITENKGIYTLAYSSDYYGKETYRIVTNGMRLDEGGEWAIYVKYGSYMSYVGIGTAKGEVGNNKKFTLSTGCEEWMRYDYSIASECEVEYSIGEIDEVFYLTLTSAKGIITENLKTPESSTYIIDYDIVEPLAWKGLEMVSGEVFIVYRDIQAQTRRTLIVEIANKIVTFVTPKVE